MIVRLIAASWIADGTRELRYGVEGDGQHKALLVADDLILLSTIAIAADQASN